MKKTIYSITLVLMVFGAIDAFSIPFGRSKLPCAARNSKDCRDPETYRQDRKNGCAKITSNCIKEYCARNCVAASLGQCDTDCSDCAGVFLGGTYQQRMRQVCVPNAVTTLDDSLQASYKEDEDKRKRKLRLQAGRVQSGQFSRDLKEYAYKMKEFNQAAAGYREGTRLVKKYQDRFEQLRNETSELRSGLMQSYGRDPIMKERIQQIEKDYNLDMSDQNTTLRSRDPRKLRNLYNAAGRGLRSATQTGYSATTDWEEPGSSPESVDQASVDVSESDGMKAPKRRRTRAWKQDSSSEEEQPFLNE